MDNRRIWFRRDTALGKREKKSDKRRGRISAFKRNTCITKNSTKMGKYRRYYM
ncbi:tail I [Wolbachia endosymbiont wVitB of Nasonia vitripennis phage WOVitB]|nr:tail I [Wolbachia endosymbiont wVitB of Nasonia vitripennis phage WOVitB]